MRDHMKTQAHMSAQLLQDADNDETPQFLLEIEEESLGLQEHPAVIEMIHDDSNQGFETYETYEDPTIQDDQSQDLEETTRTDNANFLKFYYESAPKTFDVFIISADKTVTYAHRTVLAAACEYFRDIFSSSVHFEIEPVIHIYLPDYTYEVIQLLIQFLYTGEVYLPSNLVEEFSFLCGDLKIRSHNSKSKDEDPILVDIASFVCFNDSQNENEDESQVEFLEEPNQMEEIEDESQPNYEEKFVLYIDNDFNKAVDDISSGENIQLVSLRYNIDQKVLLEHLHNQNKLKRKSEPPDEETRHMNKKPKIQTNNFKTVFQLRAEQNNFKKRLQDAVNSIKCGSSLESAEELFGIPIQVLQRNIKGII